MLILFNRFIIVTPIFIQTLAKDKGLHRGQDINTTVATMLYHTVPTRGLLAKQTFLLWCSPYGFSDIIVIS